MRSAKELSSESSLPLSPSVDRRGLTSSSENPYYHAKVKKFLGFFSELTNRLRELRAESLSKLALAREVEQLIQDLIRLETGACNTIDGIKLFGHQLSAEQSWADLIDDLYHQANMVLRATGAIDDPVSYNTKRTLQSLHELLEWYGRRKNNLLLLNVVSENEASDEIFGLHVIQDVEWGGVRGLEVRCSLRLIGHASQSLWLRANILRGEEFVSARPDWLYWIDDTDSFVVSSTESGDAFASIAPIVAERNRELIDTAKLFIPYDALDLDSGRVEVGIALGLYDQQGECVLSGQSKELIYVPSVEVRNNPIPSPQALGMWPEDLVTGDRISQLRTLLGVRSMEGYEEDVVSILCDIDLFGHEEESLSVECRFVTENGESVQGVWENASHADGSFLYRGNISVHESVAKLVGHRIEIPLAALDIDPGKHVLCVELSIHQPNGRILVGLLHRFEFEYPKELLGSELQQRPEQPMVSKTTADLDMRFLTVAPNWQLGQHGECVRVSTVLASDDWNSNPYRVLFQLETENGEILVNRHDHDRAVRKALCVGGFELAEEQAVVMNFDVREIHSDLERRFEASERIKLVARVRVYSIDDRVVLEGRQGFYYKPSGKQGASSAGAQAPYGSIVLADLENRATNESGIMHCITRLNIEYSPSITGKFLLYYEVLDQVDSMSLGLNSEGEEAEPSLPGTVLNLDFSSRVKTTRFHTGWFQATQVLECRVKSEGLFPNRNQMMKIMLFSDSGRLLQVINHSLATDESLLVNQDQKISHDDSEKEESREAIKLRESKKSQSAWKNFFSRRSALV